MLSVACPSASACPRSVRCIPDRVHQSLDGSGTEKGSRDSRWRCESRAELALVHHGGVPDPTGRSQPAASPSRGPGSLIGRLRRSFEDSPMPLFDHFHPPLYPHHHWESFHSNWATRIADGIAAVLPADFQVEEHTHAGVGFEIDVAAFEEKLTSQGITAVGPSLATLVAPAYAPPAPDH